MVVDVSIYTRKGKKAKHYGKAVKSIDEAIEYLNEVKNEVNDELATKIKVGDYVKIVNTGAMYSTYSTFFIEEIKNSSCVDDNSNLVNWAARYDYGTSWYGGLKNKVEDKFIVKYISERGIAVIDTFDGKFNCNLHKTYLIDLDGLERW